MELFGEVGTVVVAKLFDDLISCDWILSRVTEFYLSSLLMRLQTFGFSHTSFLTTSPSFLIISILST